MMLDFMQAVNNSIMASIAYAFVDDLINGALLGIVIGIVVGAIVMPMVKAPDTMLRSVVFAILAAVGMAVFQLARIARATGEKLGTVLGAFFSPSAGNLGGMIIEGLEFTLYAMLAGALVGVTSQVPDKVIKGGVVGLFLGAAVGAGLNAIFRQYRIPLGVDSFYFRLMVAGITWALFTVIVGGDE